MQYKQQSVNTMSGGELLILLYDEILKNLKLASQLYDNKDYINAEKCTEKAKKVFSHLSSTLDFNIDISNQLYSLYDFFIKQIVSAEVKRDKTPLAEVINLVAELKDTYAQASKIAHINK
ncbi:MAG: flagellar export chaperone FliS [Oscillospiraceae bacterium]